MTHLFKTVRFYVAAMMLAAFGLTSNAALGADKEYSLFMEVVPGTSPVTVSATFTNIGNSSFNSLTLKAPSGLEITEIVRVSPQVGIPSLVSGGTANQLKLTDINLPVGAGAGQYVTITFKVRAIGSTSCGVPTDFTGWGAPPGTQPWTGSSLTGSKFKLVGTVPATRITPACTYTLTGLPGSIPAGATVPATLVLTNAISGAPNITSLTVTAPSGLSIAGIPASVDVANGQPTSIPVTVTAGCTAVGGPWGSSASNGSTSFMQTNTLPTTSVTGKCALRFVTQPTEVVSGEVFNVTINAVAADNSAIALACPVSLTLAGPGTLGLGGCTSPAGVVTIPVTINGTGDFAFTLTASVPGYLPASTFPPFTVVTGIILCYDPLGPLSISNPPTASLGDPSAYPPISPSVGFARGMRGPNKDGSPCTTSVHRIPYTFLNDIPTNNRVTLTWDAVAAPYAVFRYQVTLKDEPQAPLDGLPSGLTILSFPDEGSPNGPKVDRWGVGCLSSDFPGPFGKVSSADPITTTGLETVTIEGIKIGGLTDALKSFPDPLRSIAIRIGSERMIAASPTVTQTTPTYTVTYNLTKRGDGTTTPSSHAANAPVFITPMPVDPNQFRPGSTAATPLINSFYDKQVSMCIISERWEATSGGWYRPTIDVFDIGDGGISRFSE